jgi:hypothetical protein
LLDEQQKKGKVFKGNTFKLGKITSKGSLRFKIDSTATIPESSILCPKLEKVTVCDKDTVEVSQGM